MVSSLRALLEKETRERTAESAETRDKFEKENADLRDRLGKEVAGREADVKELQVWVGIQWRADGLLFDFVTCPNYQKLP